MCSGKQNNGHLRQYDNSANLIADNKTDEYTEFRYYIRNIKMRYSQKRKHVVGVDLPYLKKVWENQKGVCPYTGIKLVLRKFSNNNEIPKHQQASLDRIDSNKGYIKDNIQFISLMANWAKNNCSHEEMLLFCESIQKTIAVHNIN